MSEAEAVVKSRAGRPRTSPDGNRRSSKVVVYVSPVEQQTLRSEADNAGQTYSAYVREKLLGGSSAAKASS